MKEKLGELESLRGLTRSNISNDIYDQLSEMIIGGKLPPGYVFPNELTLCQHMGVGRSSLREAIRTLEAMGFITRTKRGTYVNDKPQNEILPFPVILKRCKVQDNIEFRETLETGIAALAAERATSGDIAKLAADLKKMEKNADDINLLSYYDVAFHYHLAEASGNELLIATLKMVRDSVEIGMVEAFQKDPGIVKRALEFHTHLLQAVKKHDPIQARDIMTKHMKDVANTVKVHS